MKKLMTLMLGAAFAFGAMTVYAGTQDPQPKTKKSTKKSTKAPKKDADKK